MPGHHQEKGAATARHSHHPREAISVVASTHCIPTSLSQGVKPAGDAALVPRPLHCHTVIAEGQRGHYLSSPGQESTTTMMGTEHTVPDRHR